MIDALLFGALGFLLGCLLALALASPLWNRAVKLTTRQLEATMPMTLNDIQADKDQLRAEFAIELRKVEVALDKAREKAARELIEANKRRAELAALTTDLSATQAKLQENENANRVLQQTIKRRLPDLDGRLKAAKKALAELETVNAELRTTVSSQSDALKTARTTLHNQRTDIDRLRAALESGSGGAMRGLGKPDARTLAESQRLSAELSKAQEELERARISAEENGLLRRELSRLSSQILAVARAQGMAPPAPETVGEVTEVFVEDVAVEAQDEQESEAQQDEQRWRHEHAQNGNGAEYASEADDRLHAAEADAGGNGTEHADEVAARMSAQSLAPAEDEAEAEEEDVTAREEPKSFARKFVARREARRARKAGGTSLRDRLRGLTADRPER